MEIGKIRYKVKGMKKIIIIRWLSTGRPIIVDWAVSKDRFEKMQEEAVKKEIKKEDDNDEDTKSLKTSKAGVKKEEQSDEESEEDSKEDR